VPNDPKTPQDPEGALTPSDQPPSEQHSSFARDLLRRGGRELERARMASDSFGQGVVALYEKRYPQAVRLLQDAIRQNRENAEAHYYLGVTRFMLGWYSAAVESYSAAIDRGYAEPHVAQGLGDALFLLERYQEAAEAYGAVVKVRPNADAYARMGQAFSLIGRREDAVAAFREALLLKLASVSAPDAPPPDQ
jgi:tetratricopeptide (TPR) repeat protein